MGELTPKQEARLTALNEITALVASVNYGTTTFFPHKSNHYMNDKKKKLIDREIENILFQLSKRAQKLERILYG